MPGMPPTHTHIHTHTLLADPPLRDVVMENNEIRCGGRLSDGYAEVRGQERELTATASSVSRFSRLERQSSSGDPSQAVTCHHL